MDVNEAATKVANVTANVTTETVTTPVHPVCIDCQSPTNLTCPTCQKPHHLACIPLLKLWSSPPLNGDLLYSYDCCKNGLERLNVEWKDMVAIALFNSLSSTKITEVEKPSTIYEFPLFKILF